MSRKSPKKTGEENISINTGLHPHGIIDVDETCKETDIILPRNNKRCNFDIGCENTASKRGMCEKHYRQWWRANNRDHHKEYERQYYQHIMKPIRQLKNKPKERICLRCGKQFTRVSRQIYCSLTCQNNIQHRNKRKNNPEFKLIHNIRSRLRKALKGSTRDRGILLLLGCSGNELKSYIESRWQPGMTWENYGLHGWHIDHIKPLSTFILSDPVELKIACHYTNLQPLWREDHVEKSNSERKEV